MLKVLSNILCDLDPKVKVIGQKAGICDGVPSTSALVVIFLQSIFKLVSEMLTLTETMLFIMGRIQRMGGNMSGPLENHK